MCFRLLWGSKERRGSIARGKDSVVVRRMPKGWLGRP